MKFDFLKPTLIFTFIGIFIPGFNAMGVVGLQWLLTKAGMKCSAAFGTIFLITSFLAVLFPLIFYRYITKHSAINGKIL